MSTKNLTLPPGWKMMSIDKVFLFVAPSKKGYEIPSRANLIVFLSEIGMPILSNTPEAMPTPGESLEDFLVRSYGELSDSCEESVVGIILVTLGGVASEHLEWTDIPGWEHLGNGSQASAKSTASKSTLN